MVPSDGLQISNPILSSKLYIPASRPNWVMRSALIEWLQTASRCVLTLISAPPGFGKSTLLGQWAQQSEFPVAWLTLDETDNDLHQFVSYLIAALRTVQADLGQHVLAALQVSPMPPPEDLVSILVQDMESRSERFVLVLDDYHFIHRQPIHTAVTFLLRHMPLSLHLIISSRADPPLPLSRLRVQEELAELRAVDLRFTREETAQFFQGASNVHLTDSQIRVLEGNTEGWAAGLQLAALALQGRSDSNVSQFVKSFHGDHRLVVDYLIEEVFDQLSPAIRSFLLQTCVLERLSASLCNALTAGNDGQVILEQLDQTNLFLIPLDDRRQWYRYHHLFGDFLRRQLVRVWPEQEVALHRKASAWYCVQGILDEAAEHALRAADWENAADLLERFGPEAASFDRHGRWLSLVERLPPEVVQANADLCLWYGLFLIRGGQMHAASEPLDWAKAIWTAGNNSAKLGRVYTIRAHILDRQGRTRKMVESARRALALLSEDDLYFRGAATFWLGSGLRVVSGAEEAYEQIVRAIEINQTVGNHYLVSMCQCILGVTLINLGKLHQAYDVFRRNLTAIEEGQYPPIGYAYFVMAELLYEWNRLDEAERWLRRGLEIVQSHGRVAYWPHALMLLARILAAMHRPDEGAQAIQQALLAVRQTNAQEKLPTIRAHQARYLLAQGKLDAALACMDVAEPLISGLERMSPAEIAQHQNVFSIWIRLLIVQGRTDEASVLIDRLLRATKLLQREGNLTVILVLQALVLDAQGDASAALVVFIRALSRAEREGRIRTFVDRGEPVKMLLHRAAARTTTAGYAGELLAAFDESHIERQEVESFRESSTVRVPSGPGRQKRPFNGPLSEREEEVLCLIAAGRSTRGLATELVISIHTVRTHLKNIYRKLEVNSRVQAVEKARELGLL